MWYYNCLDIFQLYLQVRAYQCIVKGFGVLHSTVILTKSPEMWIRSKKQDFNNSKNIPSDICRKDEVASVTFHPSGWCSEDWKHLIWRVRHVRGNCDHGLWISSRRIWIRWFDQMVQRQSRILSNRATYLHRKGQSCHFQPIWSSSGPSDLRGEYFLMSFVKDFQSCFEMEHSVGWPLWEMIK